MDTVLKLLKILFLVPPLAACASSSSVVLENSEANVNIGLLVNSDVESDNKSFAAKIKSIESSTPTSKKKRSLESYETEIAKALYKTKGKLWAEYKYDNSFSLEVNGDLRRHSVMTPQPYTFEQEFANLCNDLGGSTYKCDFSGELFTSTSQDYLCTMSSDGEEHDLSEYSYSKPSDFLTIDPNSHINHESFYTLQFYSQNHGGNIHKNLAKLMGHNVDEEQEYDPQVSQNLAPSRYDSNNCVSVWVLDNRSVVVIGE